MRLRVWSDRLIVLVVLIGAWQIGSALLGNYWLSTPWATVSRFFISLFNGELGSELARVGIRGPDDFLVRKTGSRTAIASILSGSGTPANSDYFPYLDLNAGRARYKLGARAR